MKQFAFFLTALNGMFFGLNVANDHPYVAMIALGALMVSWSNTKSAWECK